MISILQELLLYEKSYKMIKSHTKGRTIKKEKGGREFSACIIFFLTHCLCRIFICSGETLCTNFFLDKY